MFCLSDLCVPILTLFFLLFSSLSPPGGSHIDAKACLRCCDCMKNDMHELGPNCTDQFCCETVPLSKTDCGDLDSFCASRVTGNEKVKRLKKDSLVSIFDFRILY